MWIFIDFDDVIFNTKQFKDDFKKMFLERGISEELFERHYNDPNDKRAIKAFDPWRQLDGISKELKIDPAELNGMVLGFLKNSQAYVFEDVRDFAKKFKQEKIQILSYGELKFQEEKIKNSKIKDHIKDIIITNDKKSTEIKKIIEQQKIPVTEKVFFLDDRVEQIEDVKVNCPRVTTILIRRPEGRYPEMHKEKYCDLEAANLKEVEKLIV